MPAPPSAAVILWKTSETLIATVLVVEREGSSAERVLVRHPHPTIPDSLVEFARLPIHEQTSSSPAPGVGVVLLASLAEFAAG